MAGSRDFICMSARTRRTTTLPDDFSTSNYPTNRRTNRNMAAAVPPAGGGAGAGAGAGAPPAPAPEIWTENPIQGNFNPGTKSGAEIFKLKSQGLPQDKRLSLDKKDAPTFRRLLEAKEPTFGQVLTHIPVTFAPDGSATGHLNLISNYSSVTLEQLQRRALARYGTAIAETDAIPATPWNKSTLTPGTNAAHKTIFYDRVNANVVHEWLKNVLDDQAYAELLLQKESFQFIDPTTGNVTYDGVIMLFLALKRFDPSVIVGVECLRAKLETIKLHTYNNKVDDMCLDFQNTLKEIKRLGGNCESERRYLISALMSGPNAKFNSYIDRIKDDVEARSGPYKDMTVNEILTSAKTKYATMDRTGEWTKVDPRDAQLLALTTEAKQLKEQVSSLKALGTQSNASQQGGGGGRSGGGGNGQHKDTDIVGGVEYWRTVNKGQSLMKNGKPWSWCPHHKHPHGHFNGLYCLHKPEEHDEWKARYKKGKPSANATSGNPAAASGTPASGNDASKKLVISSRLKEVLLTNLMLSDEDAEKICKECEQGN